MPIYVKSVDRTRITMDGEVPEQILRDIFNDVIKTTHEKFVSARYEFDREANETTMWLQPCRTYVIHADPELHARTHCPVSCERKVMLKGSLPDFVDFNEKYWVPFRKGCKRTKDPSRWVVMYLHDVYEDQTPMNKVGREADYTEVCLIVDNRCPQEDIPDALDLAAAYVSEKLRLIVSDINPSLMRSAIVLDQVSSDFASAIEQANDDEIQARYNEMGLRRVNLDAPASAE